MNLWRKWKTEVKIPMLMYMIPSVWSCFLIVQSKNSKVEGSGSSSIYRLIISSLATRIKSIWLVSVEFPIDSWILNISGLWGWRDQLKISSSIAKVIISLFRRNFLYIIRKRFVFLSIQLEIQRRTNVFQ